ncbi:MAG: cytochrome c [Bacteroidota bacterium]
MPPLHIGIQRIMLMGLMVLFLSGCYYDKSDRNIEYAPNMYNSLPLEPYSQTAYNTQPWIGGHYPAAEEDGMVKFFKNGLSAQKAPEGTVPRVKSWYYEEAYSPYPYPETTDGYELAGEELTTPIEETDEIREKGKVVYEIYCVMCHGPQGKGQGSLVTGGAYVGVPSYETLYLPEGKMFHTLTYGKGQMGSYASQITPRERWEVIAYIKKWFPNYNGASEEATDETVTADATPAPAEAESDIAP